MKHCVCVMPPHHKEMKISTSLAKHWKSNFYTNISGVDQYPIINKRTQFLKLHSAPDGSLNSSPWFVLSLRDVSALSIVSSIGCTSEDNRTHRFGCLTRPSDLISFIHLSMENCSRNPVFYKPVHRVRTIQLVLLHEIAVLTGATVRMTNALG